MIYVYILESQDEPESYYQGVTRDLRTRLEQHNSGQVAHTSKFKPWKIKNYFAFKDEQKAYAFERYLKSGSGRAFVKKHF